MERLREVQRPHKSDKITVAQAKKAWLKVERENASKTTVSRSASTGQFVKKDTAASDLVPSAGTSPKRSKRDSSSTKHG
ncbi:MAG TPA: hypothetical protein VK358_15085 [Longimicrobium sp.]|jgi:hypothetical protein|nr:hypothetical protein [Longimicrobium sp.]